MEIDETKLKAEVKAFFRSKGYEIDQITFNERRIGPMNIGVMIQNTINVVAVVNQPIPEVQKALEEAGVTK